MTLFVRELIHTLFVLPMSFTGDYIAADLLQIRHRVRYAAIVSLLHSISQLLFGWLGTLGLAHSPNINAFVQIVIYIIPPLVISREPVPRRVLAAITCFLALMFSSVVGEAVFVALGGEIHNTVAYLESNPFAYTMMFFVSFLMTLASMTLVRLVWNRLLGRAPVRVLKPYLLFPVSQWLLIVLTVHFASLDVFQPIRYLLILLATLFCVAADIVLLRSIRAASEKAVAEERAHWYETLLEQQEQTYAYIMADQEDAAKIRHDIRNQLQTAYALMENGSGEEARRQLDEVRAIVNAAPSYCANRLINALLSVKAGQMEAAGVALDCRADVPERIALPGTELCSLFSNVLDNALRAAQDVLAREPVVALRAGITGNVFTLVCKNPYDAEKQAEIRPGHGLGLEILRDLAERHDGTLTAKAENGEFTVTVQLLLPAQEE